MNEPQVLRVESITHNEENGTYTYHMAPSGKLQRAKQKHGIGVGDYVLISNAVLLGKITPGSGQAMQRLAEMVNSDA